MLVCYMPLAAATRVGAALDVLGLSRTRKHGRFGHLHTAPYAVDTLVAAADGGVMLMGSGPQGIWSVKLDPNGRPFPAGGYIVRDFLATLTHSHT